MLRVSEAGLLIPSLLAEQGWSWMKIREPVARAQSCRKLGPWTGVSARTTDWCVEGALEMSVISLDTQPHPLGLVADKGGEG